MRDRCAELVRAVLLGGAFMTLQPCTWSETISLECDKPITVTIPLDKSSPQWPKDGYRFTCLVQRLELAVVAASQQPSSSQWVPLADPVRVSIGEESPFTLPLTNICSSTTGVAGSLIGHLKWGDVGVGLRNCAKRSHGAIKLEMRATK